MNIQSLYAFLVEKYGDSRFDVVNPDNTRENVFLRFDPAVSGETRQSMVAEIAAFDFEAPAPDPQQFLKRAAAESPEIFAAAQQLAALAGNEQALKKKYSELELSQDQKAVLEQAAEAAGVAIQTKKEVTNADTILEERS